MPGAVVITIREGRTKHQVVRGWADKAAATPLTVEHLFPLGRLTEPLTAYGLLRMEKQRSVKLDLPVNTYLDDWAVSEGPYNPGDVTIRGLLSHSAGIEPWPEDGLPKYGTLTTLDKLEGKGGFPSVRIQDRPGAGYQYARAGYLILQKVVEDITGMPFAAYMQKSILPEVAVHTGGFTNRLPVDSTWAKPHAWNGTVPGGSFLVPVAAAGGAYMQPLDYVHFWETLMTPNDSLQQVIWKQLQRRQIEAMPLFLPSNVGYGFGTGLERRADSLILMTGFSQWPEGWAHGYCMLPDRQAGVFVFTNGIGGDALVNRVVSMWAQQQQNIAPPRKVKIAFWLDWVAIVLILMILVAGIHLAYWLYQTRTRRSLGIYSVTQAMVILAWLVMVVLTIQFVFPEIMTHLPHFFLLSAVPLSIYLLLLLTWLVVPVRHNSAG